MNGSHKIPDYSRVIPPTAAAELAGLLTRLELYVESEVELVPDVYIRLCLRKFGISVDKPVAASNYFYEIGTVSVIGPISSATDYASLIMLAEQAQDVAEIGLASVDGLVYPFYTDKRTGDLTSGTSFYPPGTWAKGELGIQRTWAHAEKALKLACAEFLQVTTQEVLNDVLSI